MPLNKFKNAIKSIIFVFLFERKSCLHGVRSKLWYQRETSCLKMRRKDKNVSFTKFQKWLFHFFSLNGRYFSELLVFETVLLKVLNFWSENFAVRKVLRGELEQKPFLIIANNNLLWKDIFLNRQKETRDFGWSLHKRLIKSDHGSNGTRRSYGRLLWHPMDLWRYVVASPWQ